MADPHSPESRTGINRASLFQLNCTSPSFSNHMIIVPRSHLSFLLWLAFVIYSISLPNLYYKVNLTTAIR